MPLRHVLWILLVSACITLLPPCSQALAQPSKIDAQVNIPYIVQYGFGSYSVGGITTDTYRLPLTQCFPVGNDDDGLTLRFTSYLGYTHASFETSLLGPKLEINQDYVFIMPQLELLIPMESGVVLKPYLSLGGGYAFNGKLRIAGIGDMAVNDIYELLYSGGIGAHYEQQFDQYSVHLGGRFGWAGEQAFDSSSDQNFGTLQLGLEVGRPIGLTLGTKELDLAASFIYYRFLPAAEFSMQADESLKVENQYELGLTLGLKKPNKLWIFNNPRIGGSYRFGDGLTGFRLNLGFPF